MPALQLSQLTLLVILILFTLLSYLSRRNHQRFYRKQSGPWSFRHQHHSAFPRKKPRWVKRELLQMHSLSRLSHRKLADVFNQRFYADTGISVGRTYVRELIKQHVHHTLHQQQLYKHRPPQTFAPNEIWAVDTSCVKDTQGNNHCVIGIIDHGSRFNVSLHVLKRFNSWTLLGVLFLAIGQFGKPQNLRMDNHPVHHAKLVKVALRYLGIRRNFTQLASPWQNGRIERFFGSFKVALKHFTIKDRSHLLVSLPTFQFWYNNVRTHQYLGGLTPTQAWRSIKPFEHSPKKVIWFQAWNQQLSGWLLRH